MENIVEPSRPQMTIQHSACALHAGYIRLQTHADYVMLYRFSTATIVSQIRLNVTFEPTLLLLLTVKPVGVSSKQ